MREIIVNLCQCNNCGGIFIDTNPAESSPKYLILEIKYRSLERMIEDGSGDVMMACPDCKTDGYLNDEINIEGFYEKKVEIKTDEEILRSINEVLAESSPAFIADIANRVLTEKVRYIQRGLDSYFITYSE